MNLSAADSVVKEAEINCIDKNWSPFICVLALASVLRREICTYYPDFGQQKFLHLFNQTVKPRLCIIHNEPLHLLLCNNNTCLPDSTFNFNHYVPLMFLNSSSKIT